MTIIAIIMITVIAIVNCILVTTTIFITVTIAGLRGLAGGQSSASLRSFIPRREERVCQQRKDADLIQGCAESV